MKFIKKTMIVTATIIAVLVIGIYLFTRQAVFGKEPSGARLERIKKSPNYKNDAFQNLTPTVVTREGASYIKLMRDAFNKPATVSPDSAIPSIKTDLKNMFADKPVIVWFGHSSYLIKFKGINILVDPVFSGAASPVSFFGNSFKGTDVYNAGDMPEIDMLIITHDHYDHLDYKTLLALQPKIKKIYTALGVGSHLEYWGFNPDRTVELDWWESNKVSDNIEITATPARHFSGRSFTRYKTLWASFVLKVDNYNIFIGGDSGYEQHFKLIGNKFGPFDIAMLEAGQYGADWPYIHMLPEETVEAAKDLGAKVLFPVHWTKFALASHDWNEPANRVKKSANEKNQRLTTPMIGEMVIVDSLYPDQSWWSSPNR
jgi:L-ascorbate metabolism protein UlaG (beta-lactamase superfamily)